MPVLVLATYGASREPMAMNVDWGGICAENKVILPLGPATVDQLAACD